ncbi:MAG: metallophosphoesterase family protein [Planctomycetota bacterium]
MRFAVISDLHSNLEALEAVLADIDARGLETIYCLGDVVGYGPDPVPCVDLVMARCAFTIRGNHDDALFHGADRFNPYARAAIDWTRDRIKPGFFRGKSNAARWKFLEELPLEKKVGRHYFVHGSPRDHVNEYIYREDVFFNAEGKLRRIFDATDHVLFVGHTHLPVIIGSDLKTWVPGELESERRLDPALKYIVNVGSVGQPRDRDPRACWVEVEDELIRYHRVAYDVEAVRAKIARQRALDPVLGTRLVEGT